MWLRRSSPLSYLCRYLHHGCDRMDQIPFEAINDWMVEFNLNAAVIQLQVWNVARYNRECVRVRIHLHKFFFSHSDWIWSEIYGDGALGSSVVLKIKIESLKLLWGCTYICISEYVSASSLWNQFENVVCTTASSHKNCLWCNWLWNCVANKVKETLCKQFTHPISHCPDCLPGVLLSLCGCWCDSIKCACLYLLVPPLSKCLPVLSVGLSNYQLGVLSSTLIVI